MRSDRKALASDRRWRVTVLQAIDAKLRNATDSSAGIDVNDMQSTLANALRHKSAHTLPRCPERTPSRGSSELYRAQDRFHKARDRRKGVWKKLLAVLKKALKVTKKAVKRVRNTELTISLSGPRILFAMKQSDTTYVRSATGELCRDKQATLQR